MLKKSLILIFLVLLADQIVKFWIKTHMLLGQEYHVFGHWCNIHFTENNGMAYGMEFSGNYGKLFLSLFRIVAIFAIAWYLVSLTKKKDIPFGLIASISLIVAGAFGNLIDSAFYGMIFSESTPYELAQFLPPEGGYGTFLHGKVVDMLYFPLFTTRLPEWLPFWAGDNFTFFGPVFNLADSSITTGVLMLIVFQKRYFRKIPDEAEKSASVS